MIVMAELIGTYRQWLSETQSLQNAQIIATYLTGKGWTKNAIAAMLGNMRHESSINPDMYEFSADWADDRGYGLVQWTPRSKYWDWAVARGLPPRAGTSQLARIDYEAANNIQWISTSSYPMTFAQFRSSNQDVATLTEAFTWNYERPNAEAGASSMAARKAFAQRSFTSLKWEDTGVEEPPTSPSTPSADDWKNSDATSVELLWTPFESIIPVNPDKELLVVNFELINEENFPVYFDEMYVYKNLLNDKLLAAETTFIPIDGAPKGKSFNQVVFAALDIVKVVSVHYVPESPMVGSNSDYMQLRLEHSLTDVAIATKTYIKDTDAPGMIVSHFGPVLPSQALLAPDASVRLVKVETGAGMTLPKGVLIIRWDIA